MSLTHPGGFVSAQYNGLNYPVTTVEYLVVAGGGGAGSNVGGGGGAGGLLTATGYSITLGSSITITVGAGGAGAGLLPPQSLHLQIIQNCIVTAHKTLKNKLQILFKVPSTSPVIGLLENPGAIPNAALRFKLGWTGPMKVLDPKKVQGSWQCTLRPA